MKIFSILIIFISFFSHSNAINNDVWIAFQDSTTELIGFKNSKDSIVFIPKLMGYTYAKKFDKIIAAMEKENDNYIGYYLLKSGKKIGFDSLYTFDNSADCESDGFIRFKDKSTDKVGLINGKGDVVISAMYDALSPISNGLSVSLKNAKKKQLDELNHSGCNHFYWTGGKESLIDTNNNIVVDNFPYNSNLNFYTLTISDSVSTDSTWESFIGSNGKYYSFLNNSKDFKQWLNQLLREPISMDKLRENCFPTVTSWCDSVGWIRENRELFTSKYFGIISISLATLKKSDCHYNIFKEDLNPYIFDINNEEYEQYFNNCGEAISSKYPVMNIVIDHEKNGKLTQDSFNFLKTENGYKLISISITQ